MRLPATQHRSARAKLQPRPCAFAIEARNLFRVHIRRAQSGLISYRRPAIEFTPVGFNRAVRKLTDTGGARRGGARAFSLRLESRQNTAERRGHYTCYTLYIQETIWCVRIIIFTRRNDYYKIVGKEEAFW